jgi:hypothetical protein
MNRPDCSLSGRAAQTPGGLAVIVFAHHIRAVQELLFKGWSS